MESAKHSLICMFFIAPIAILCLYIGFRPDPVYGLTDKEIVSQASETVDILTHYTEYEACIVDIIRGDTTNSSFQIVKVRDLRSSDTNDIFLAFSSSTYELKSEDKVLVRKYNYSEYDGSRQIVRIVQKKY